jgi:hypothetical protein
MNKPIAVLGCLARFASAKRTNEGRQEAATFFLCVLLKRKQHSDKSTQAAAKSGCLPVFSNENAKKSIVA